MNPKSASDLFRRLNREIWLVTAQAGARRGGLIATFVSQASLPPDRPRVAIGLAKQHHTWALIDESRTFGLHLLSEDQLDWVWHFGLTSGRDIDKLAGIEHTPGTSGAPILAGALGWLDCRVETSLDTGDRTIYLADVLDVSPPDDRTILTTERMLALASPAQRAELVRKMERDSAIDIAAIDAWRRGSIR